MASPNDTKEPSYKDVITSKTFLFIVGNSHVAMAIHTAHAIWASEKLRALITGDMKEAKEGSCDMEHVEPEVFARFAQWLYSGDYRAPDPEILLAAEDIAPHKEVEGGLEEAPETHVLDDEVAEAPEAPEAAVEYYDMPTLSEPVPEDVPDEWFGGVAEPDESVAEVDLSWAFGASVGTKSKKKGTNKKEVKKKRSSFDYPVEEKREWGSLYYQEVPKPTPPPPKPVKVKKVRPEPTKAQVAWKEFRNLEISSATGSPAPHVRAAPDADENYSGVFLCHAKMYVLADEFLIEPLKVLALEKLHKALVDFTLHPQRAGDIVLLAEYAFANTREEDKLRDIATKYIMCHPKTFAMSTEFFGLVKQGGDFAELMVASLIDVADV